MKRQHTKYKEYSKEKLQKVLAKKSPALQKLKRNMEIEASLERVRQKTMAMHQSDELASAAISSHSSIFVHNYSG
jgi:hypothetical protein